MLFIVYLAGRYGKKKHGHKKKNKDGENHDITVDHTHDLNKDQTPQSSRRKRSESQSEIRSGKKSFVFDPDNIDTNTPQLQPQTQTQTQTQVQSNKKAQVQAEEVNNESINIKIEEHKEYDSVLAHFARRISKDIVIWIYLAIIGFEIYWQIQCHIWIDDISPNSKCFQEAKGKNMLNALRLSMLFLWIYLSFGFSVIGLTITIRGCHQGSCNPWDLNRAFILWITCSKVDIKNSSSSGMINFETSKERFIENVKEYSEGRAKWIEKTYNLLNNLGLGGKPYKVKNIEASKRAEDPHGVSVNIRTFDQINHLNTTEANLNQNQTRNDMIESSPYERKLSSRLSKKLEAHLSIPNIKSFEKI